MMVKDTALQIDIKHSLIQIMRLENIISLTHNRLTEPMIHPHVQPEILKTKAIKKMGYNCKSI